MKYTTAITVRLKPEQYNKLSDIAEELQIAKGALIRQAVAKLLKEYK